MLPNVSERHMWRMYLSDFPDQCDDPHSDGVLNCQLTCKDLPEDDEQLGKDRRVGRGPLRVLERARQRLFRNLRGSYLPSLKRVGKGHLLDDVHPWRAFGGVRYHRPRASSSCIPL